MALSRSKNGKIECMRFVFSILVILYHCHRTFGFEEWIFWGVRLPAMGGGRLCVEFFLLTAGYLMAASMRRRKEDIDKGEAQGKAMGTEALRFVWKKYCRIFPYHAICFAVLFLLRLYSRGYIYRPFEIPGFVFASLPDFFLLQKFGFPSTEINVAEWYISAMLIAMLVIYPVAGRFYNTFICVYAPVTVLFLLGAMKHKLGTFSDQDLWFYVADAGLFRAIAQLSLGMCLYELAGLLSKMKIKKKTRIMLTVLEYVCFAGSLGCILFGKSRAVEVWVLVMMAIVVALAFSEQTYFNEVFSSRWILYAGNLSLCIYLCHLLALNIVRLWIVNLPYDVRCVLVIILSLLIAVAVQRLGDALVFRIKNIDF